MKTRIPQYLHRPNQILWFETDEFILLITAATLGFSIGSWFSFFIGSILVYLYMAGKKKYSRGFFRHLPYILGVRTFKFFPHVFVNKFRE